MSTQLSATLAGALATVAMLVAASLATASGGHAFPTKDPFYSYSGSLKKVAPGTILKRRTVTLAQSGSATPITATQLLYRTTGELGQPTVTVATVVRPTPQIGPTKIVSYQTAYDALGAECDPSYTLQWRQLELRHSQRRGAGDPRRTSRPVTRSSSPTTRARHSTGEPARNPAMGRSTGSAPPSICSVLPAATTPVAMIGYSGGSIATEFASELAPRYARGLDIVGAAEGGIPVDFFHNLVYINGSPKLVRGDPGGIRVTCARISRQFQELPVSVRDQADQSG